MTPDIALAASTREWPDRLHRHLLDHGGGRVVGRVMSSEQAIESSYDVLLIDDVCSFLTPRLVSVVKSNGSDVVGVFASEDGSDAKRRLLECGISDVIEMEAGPAEFLEKVATTISHRPPPTGDLAPDTRRLFSIGVTGPTEGVGTTEVAAALAMELARSSRAVLVDLDPVWPSISQRLDLPVHPNLRTALDAAMHSPDRVSEGVMSAGRLSVVGGIADGGRGAPVSRVEVAALFELLGSSFDILISDLGPYERSVKGLGQLIDLQLVVGTADPVGVTRLLKTLEAITALQSAVLAVVNKTPRRRFHDAEVRAELGQAFPAIPVVSLPFDPRIHHATWEGVQLPRGSLRKAIRRVARLMSGSLGQ